MKNTPSSGFSNQELFNAVKRDDPDCVAMLYDEFYDYVVSFIYKHYETGIESVVRISREDVKDVINDLSINSLSILQGKIRNGEYEPRENIKMSTYLMGICKHLASDYLRKRRITVFGLEGELIDGLADELDIPRYDQNQVELLRRAMRKLRDERPKCFRLLTLYANDKKMSEIATMLNFSTEDSAKTQKRKCVILLQSIYSKLNGEN